MKISIPKNFFGEDIPLTVFISQEQLNERKTGNDCPEEGEISKASNPERIKP